MPPTGRTRRELIVAGAGAALGAGATLAAGAAPAAAATVTDAQLLLPVLGIEMLAVFAYDAVLHSDLMPLDAEHVAGRILAHEREHVSTFTGALQQLGGTPPQPLKTVAAADTVLAAHQIPNRLAHLRSMRDCLTVLVRVENVLAGIYYQAVRQLQDTQLITLCGQAMGAEAQHATVLNLLLRPHDITRAVPSSYVR